MASELQNGNDGDEAEKGLAHGQTDTATDGHFIPLNIADPTAWDDTLLIKSFDAAVNAHQKSKKRPRASTTPAQSAQKRKPSSTSPTFSTIKLEMQSSASTPPPPPPPLPQPSLPSNPRDSSSALRIPPPPPSLFGATMSEDLEKLLISWYEAGYRAGQYAANHQQKNEKPQN